MKKDFVEKLYEKGVVDDYYVNNACGYVEFENGKIFLFCKPTIKTRFPVGYGQNGISTEEDFEDAIHFTKEMKEKQNFIRENLKKFDYNFSESLFGVISYTNENHVVSFMKNEMERCYRAEQIFKLTDKDKEELKKESENQKEMFKKRLETYWKKFGNSKLKTWTYLMD